MNAATRKVSEHLAKKLGDRKYDMWFGPSTRMEISGRRLEITTDSQDVADWIGTHFSRDLEEVAQNTLGDSAIVDVRVDQKRCISSENGRHNVNGAASPTQILEPTTLKPRRPSTRRPDLHLPLRHKLEDFVLGKSNRLAHSSAKHIAEASAPEGIGPLFIYGECGLGKTHLLQGACRRHLEKSPQANVRYTTGEQFTNEYITALKGSQLDAFRKKIRNLDFLAIDDIHFLSNKTATQTEFLHTLDAIDMGGARIVMASDEHPHHLRSVNRALVSRFMAGLIVEVERPDREMRVELVKRLATRRSLKLNSQAVDIIAANCIASVREIEGSLSKLAALWMISRDSNNPSDEIGCVLVERLFKVESNPGRPLRISTIVDVVCSRLCVERSELLGSTRHRRVVLARGIVSFLARDLTTMSYPEIGRALGRKNHSTVLTASRRLSDQIDASEKIKFQDSEDSTLLRELVDQLRHEIRRQSRG